MTPPASIHADALLRHADCLRALACRLLADEHAADDVVQDTWVAALERPPRSRERLGGWLNRVAGNLAKRRRRGDARRARREESAAREERIASVAETIEQREILRRVVDAVLALDEPYLGVVLERYYQGLPPREIAARRGVPVATVDSQLHRARVQLRRRLDDTDGEHGAWAPALALATGWTDETAAASAAVTTEATTGGVIVHWKLLIGAALAATGWIGWIERTTEPASSAPDARAAALDADEEARLADAAASAADDEDDAEQRVAVESEIDRVPAAPLARAAHEYVLEGVVVDAGDQPIEGASVLLAPELQPLNDVAQTGRDGAFRVVWRGDAPSATFVVHARSAGLAHAGLRRVELVAGRTNHVRLVALAQDERRIAQAVEERDAKRRELAGVPDRLRDQALDEIAAFEAVQVRRGLGEEHVIVPRIGAEPREDGSSVFRWPALLDEIWLDEVSHAETAETDGWIALEERRADELRARQSAPPSVTLTGVVYAASGEPAAGALVVVVGDGRRQRRTADGNGRFRIDLAVGQTVELVAGGGVYGLASKRFELTGDHADGEITWDPLLDRGRESSGSLAGASDESWIAELELETADGLWLDAAPVRSGRFAFANLPAGRGRVLVRRAGDPPFARAVASAVQAGGAETSFALSAEQLADATVRIALVDREGAPIEDADVRLWQDETGRGAWLEREGDGYALAGVPPGRYRLTVGTYLRGYRDLGAVWIAPNEAQKDLGRFALAEPGAVRVDAHDAAWSLWLADAPVETLVDRGDEAWAYRVFVPAGSYELRVEGAHGVMAPPRTVEVVAGETLEPSVRADELVHVAVVLERSDADEGGAVELAVYDGERRAARYAIEGETARIGLPPGSYRLEARAPSGAVGETTLTLEAGAGEASARIALERRAL